MIIATWTIAFLQPFQTIGVVRSYSKNIATTTVPPLRTIAIKTNPFIQVYHIQSLPNQYQDVFQPFEVHNLVLQVIHFLTGATHRYYSSCSTNFNCECELRHSCVNYLCWYPTKLNGPSSPQR